MKYVIIVAIIIATVSISFGAFTKIMQYQQINASLFLNIGLVSFVIAGASLLYKYVIKEKHNKQIV